MTALHVHTPPRATGKAALDSTQRLSHATASMQQHSAASLEGLTQQVIAEVREEVARLGARLDVTAVAQALDRRLAVRVA